MRARACNHCKRLFMPGSSSQTSCCLVCRALSRTERSSSGCLEFTGAVGNHGYPSFMVDKGPGKRRSYLGHRVVFEAAVRPLVAGEHVCHRCDNRRCLETAHMFVGSNADNTADKVKKGRQTKGADVPQAKLTDEVVVRVLRDARSHRAIARDLGVSPSTVSLVKSRRSWRHVCAQGS